MAEETFVWASALDDIKEKVRRWDLFYRASEADLDLVYAEFERRCIREGYKLARQGFVFRNKIKAIVDKRAEAIPDAFNFDLPEDFPNRDKIMDWLDNWVKGPNFEVERNLWGALPEYNHYLERHGNLVLRLVRDEGGNVRCHRVPLTACDVRLDASNIARVLGWKFTWNVEGEDAVSGTRVRKTIVEYIDARTYRVEDGGEAREIAHDLGFIPVVHVAVNRRGEDRFWGTSVVEDLIEPQLWVAAVMSTIREVSRWQGFPLFAGPQTPAEVDLRPGGFVVDPEGQFRAITWNASYEGLYRELEEYLSDMYELGRVARKSPEALRATGNLPSGKALLVLTHDGVMYVRRVCSLLEEAYAELLWKAVCMAGLAEWNGTVPLTVTYPPVKLMDEDVAIQRARVVLEAYGRGVLPKKNVIEALIDLGVLNPEEDPEALALQAAEEIAAALSPQVLAGLTQPPSGGEA